jgi:hypothetical protein
MTFTGPSGDGRRGSAGFVVRLQDVGPATNGASRSSTATDGTRWEFAFQRAASGFHFQVIHPFRQGHVLVSLAQGVTIHRGGSWGSIGWGSPAGSDKVELTDAGKETTASWLRADRAHQIVSQLTAEGDYQLSIDGAVMCRHRIEAASPLTLEIPKGRIWGGSSWDRTGFNGNDFNPKLQPGHAGLILAPMDGSGPTQHFKDVRLTRLPSSQPVYDSFTQLFTRIEKARESELFGRSRAMGGGGGDPFAIIPEATSVLVGFDYTTSTFYGGHLTIKSLRAVYRTPNGQVVGRWRGVPHGTVQRALARVGYVVAGAITKSGHRIDGMRVIFMKIEHDRLNPDDTYRSKWIGGQGGGPKTQLAGTGDAIIGLFGRQGHDLDALGFIQVNPY